MSIREIDGQIWLIGFLNYGFGCFDNESGRVHPDPNSFVPDKV